MLDREKVATAKIHQQQAAPNIVKSGEGSKSSTRVEKKIIGPDEGICNWA